MSDIVLSTLNAKFIHCGFGLRYLLANLGELQSRTHLIELDIQQRPLDVVEALLLEKPKIIGLGVYIWNAVPMAEVVALLKRANPEIIVILGGPETSHECDRQEIVRLADYVITGEADLRFAQLCRELLSGKRPETKIIAAQPPDLSQVARPYSFYSDDDLAHRILYVESSRGCPFSCEFCLSSLDDTVRTFPLEPFLEDMGRLLERGARHFKFVDRTFNVNLHRARAILEFFLERLRPGMLLHFEIVPDRLPEELKELITRFPPGSLQLEAGIQTFNPDTAQNISRRQDYAALEANLRFLRQHTQAHVHADLIVGLPGETIESFGEGFDKLVRLNPQEIQVGILKRLRGAPIARHDAHIVYSPQPPYEIIRNDWVDFPALQQMRRFARYWDLAANSGNFIDSTRLILDSGPSPFRAFMEFSQWFHKQTGKTHGIALERLAELIYLYLTQVQGLPETAAAQALWVDWQRAGRCEKPAFLAERITNEEVTRAREKTRGAKRQSRWSAPN